MANATQSQRESERVIGKLEEFREWAKDRFESIDKQIESVREQIDTLKKLKWQLYGGAVVISITCPLVFEFVKLFVERK